MRRVVWTLLLAAAMLAMGTTSVLAADPTTIESATMVFEGVLTDDGDGSFTGTVPMVQESVAGGGDGVDGFDVYARNGAMATYDKVGGGQDYACGPVVDNDAYTTGGGWGSYYDPDCADWNHYQLRLDGDQWYVEYVSGGSAYAPPMSGDMGWGCMYAAETGAGAYYSGMGTPETAGYALSNACTGVNDGVAAWDMDWSWGSEYIPLAFPGFDVVITDLGGGQYRVVMTPASGKGGHGAPGPVKNVTTGESYGTIQAGVDDASPADVLEADAGVYTENVLIDKELELHGAGMGDTVIDAGGSGTPLRVQGATAHISDLDVCNGEMVETEGGIALVYAPGSTLHAVHVHHCAAGIGVIGSSGVSITGSQVDQCGWGIVVDNDEVVGGDKSVVSESLMVDACGSEFNLRCGLYIAENCHGAIVTNSTFRGNGEAGVYIWKSSAHILTDNEMCGNTVEGVHLFGSQDCVVTDNTITGNDIGIKVRSGVIDSTGNAFNWNDISGNTTWGALATENNSIVVDCAFNSWGADDGPSGEGPGSGDAVSEYIEYEPFAADPDFMTIIVFPTDTQAEIQKAIDEAPAGATIILVGVGGGVFPGGLVIDRADITIIGDLDAIVGPGSPAFTVTAANVTIENLELDGTGGTPASAGIVVDGGANNCSIIDCNIHDWEDGVKITSANTSFKMVGNWLHDNVYAGLRVNPGALPVGVVTIEGNLIKENVGDGIVNEDTSGVLDAAYNSWGCLDGPNGPRGDGLDVAWVNAEPYTYVELYMDMQPAEPTEEVSVEVDEDDVFEVQLKVDAIQLTGLQFKLLYDTDMLVLQSITWENGFGDNAKNLNSAPGEEYWSSWLMAPIMGEDVAVATFEFAATDADDSLAAEVGPWVQVMDITHDESETNAAAFGGIEIFIDNAGYGAPSDPSDPGRDISETTDVDDGSVIINGLANYAGFVDLQGRTDDTGADVRVSQSAFLMATGGSVADGSYTTAYGPGKKLVVGELYDIVADAPLFLPATLSAEILDDRPLDWLSVVKLLGGDATDDDMIDIGDVSLIGGEYGKTSGFNPNADVNIDDQIDILDLVLAAGNYGLSASPW